MRILHAGTELAGWGLNGPRNVRINGSAVYEAADIILAPTKKIFARGNEISTLSFEVTHAFAALKDAQVWGLTHFRLLAKLGVCEIQCGTASSYESVFAAGAFLAAMPMAEFRGVAIPVQYSIVAAEFIAAYPVDWPGDNGGTEAVTLRGTAAISSGAESVAVIYTTPFATPPVITCNVVKPSGGGNLVATIRDDLSGVNGFTVELSGPTADADHKLNWIAVGN